jgi:hypothetical protein
MPFCLGGLLSARRASTVDMPVTRHPPCRPGRAVVPPPVPRLYSRPRCQAEPAGHHASPFALWDTGPGSLDAVAEPGQRLPGGAALLAAPPLAPRAHTVHGPTHKAGARAGVASPAVSVVGAPSARPVPPARGPLPETPQSLEGEEKRAGTVFPGTGTGPNIGPNCVKTE